MQSPTVLNGLPPTFIAIGSPDLFLEESPTYAQRLPRNGVPVEAYVYPGAIHGFEVFPGDLSATFFGALAMRRALKA